MTAFILPLKPGLHRVALLAALAALFVQSLAPPGYMPGSLASGWPVVLCPEGLPNGFLGDRRPHHDRHHHEGDQTDSAHHDPGLGGHCPLGGMLDTAAPATPYSAALAIDRAPAADVEIFPAPPAASRARAYLSRAPPAPV